MTPGLALKDSKFHPQLI